MLAFWLLRTFVVLAGNQLPRASTIAIDGRVLLFTAVITVARRHLLRTLAAGADAHEGARGVGPRGRHTHRQRSGRQIGNGLVVAEIALAFALLVGGGLLIKNLTAAAVARRRASRPSRSSRSTWRRPVHGMRSRRRSVRSTTNCWRGSRRSAACSHVGSTSHLPMYRFGDNGEMQIEGKLPWDANDAPLVEYRWYRRRLLQGAGDPAARRAGCSMPATDEGTTTVLVNRTMAEKFWPGEDAIGKRFGQGTDASSGGRWWASSATSVRIGLTRRSPYEFYRSLEQSGRSRRRSSSARPPTIQPR